ncbi:MerR family transcriptional regulator [Sutterella sp.]|uniref:MerR family transcriptional regulator n=1 Tax=Sutterella sp. TaxID=1981025 RepID=UPI0026DF22D9|nr:MerR family transcriptional regulator [Sutterella sp.]MDO5532968.1 MerR family transcriptional regulator [Sutterella sp.]
MAKEEDGIRQYRIGEFARCMGVTPDYLKHYEQHGLLIAKQRKSGYRYYPFGMSSRILECMRLKSFGISIRDMEKMLTELDADEVSAKLDEHAEELRRRIEHDTAVLREHERLRDWYDRRSRKDGDWEVRDIAPMLFLPHSSGRDFLEDERIYEVLSDWVDWMPVVKSALQITPQEDPAAPMPNCWGLLVREDHARAHGLPVNDVVQHIPRCKCLVYHFAGPTPGGVTSVPPTPSHPLFARVKSLGFRPTGNIYRVVYMYTHINTSLERYGVYIVPIEA